jgi:hypothetical protein
VGPLSKVLLRAAKLTDAATHLSTYPCKPRIKQQGGDVSCIGHAKISRCASMQDIAYLSSMDNSAYDQSAAAGCADRLQA